MADLMEFMEFIKPRELPANLHEVVGLDDVGKKARIKEWDLIETKYGKRMKLTLEMNGETKVMFLSRAFARKIAEELGKNPNDWVGQEVKIGTTQVMIRGKVIDKVTLTSV